MSARHSAQDLLKGVTLALVLLGTWGPGASAQYWGRTSISNTTALEATTPGCGIWSPEALPRLSSLCHTYGTCLIVDEVLTGIGEHPTCSCHPCRRSVARNRTSCGRGEERDYQPKKVGPHGGTYTTGIPTPPVAENRLDVPTYRDAGRSAVIRSPFLEQVFPPTSIAA